MSTTDTGHAFEPGRPRHAQITAWLRDQVAEGRYAPGQKLPSERELEEQFSVSRITVRRSLGTLESEGLIYRQQGLGSFVAQQKITQGLVQLTSFAEDMRRAGLEPRSRVLHRAPVRAPARVAEALGLEPGAAVERLDRLRFGDDEPIAIDRTWLPLYFAMLLEPHDLEHHTVYEVLENEFDVPIDSGRYRIEAGVANSWTSEHLGVDEGFPLLAIERTSYTADLRPIYMQLRYYRADRVSFELEATRVSDGRVSGMRLDGFEPVFGAKNPLTSAGDEQENTHVE